MENSGGPASAAPAFAVLLGMCCAVSLRGAGLSASAAFAAAVLAVAGWLLLGSDRIVPGWTVAFSAVLFISAAFSLLSLYRMEEPKAFASYVSTSGRVIAKRPWGARDAILIKTGEGSFAAYVGREASPPEGSRVSLRGALFDFKRARNGGFDEFLFWRGKGASKRVEVLDMRVISEPSGISKWRGMLDMRIKDALPERMAGYMLALTVGARDKNLTDLHRSAGTLHLLSVSGFHVGILALVLSFIFRSGATKVACISLFMWLYILFAGAPAGGVRAAVMLQAYLLGLAAGRPSYGFNSVGIAGVLMLLYNPWCFFDVGWRLSMSAALFLSAWGPFMRRSWAHAAAMSVLVWFVTAPQSAAAFDQVPLAGLLVNMVAIPLFGLIFPAVFLMSLPSLLGLPFSSFLSVPCEYMLELWEVFSNAAAGLVPWGIGYTAPLTVFASMLASASAAYASGFRAWKIPFAAMIFSAFILFLA